MKPAPGSGRIYEFACDEGNHGMVGILGGHRAQERPNNRPEGPGRESRT